MSFWHDLPPKKLGLWLLLVLPTLLGLGWLSWSRLPLWSHRPTPILNPTEKPQALVGDYGVFVCSLDLGQVQRSLVAVYRDLYIRRWAACTTSDSHTTLAVPLWLENTDNQTYLLTLAIGSHQSRAIPFDEQFIDVHLDKVIASTFPGRSADQNLVPVSVLTGKTADDFLSTPNPFSQALEGHLGNQMRDFTQRGTIESLPILPGMEYPVILPFRVKAYE